MDVLEDLVNEVFDVHDAALAFGMSEAKRLGDDHPRGLACGCDGAPMYAAALMQLLGRHLEGICRLAQLHPGYVYPARTLARAMLDHAGRVLWLLEPESLDDREVRFLAAKAEETRLILASNPDGEQPDWKRIARDEFGADLPGIPSFAQMAQLFPMPDLIVQNGYRELSQASHGTTIGSATLNQEARQRWPKEAGNVPEFIASAFWTDLLEIAALASHTAKVRFAERLAPQHSVNTHDIPRDVFDLMKQLPAAVEHPDSEILKAATDPRPNRKTRRAAIARSRKGRGR